MTSHGAAQPSDLGSPPGPLNGPGTTPAEIRLKHTPGALRVASTAFTLLELLLVIAIIALLAALLLPAIQKGLGRGRQAQCLSQLRQIGAAFHLFAQDHGDQLPMQLAGATGTVPLLRPPAAGLPPFPDDPAPFVALSNELKTPALLVCRADNRKPAADFATLRREHLSYRAGRWATLADPGSILALDRNLTNEPTARGSTSNGGNPGVVFTWTPALHDRKGNVLFADGRVELLKSLRLDASIPRGLLPLTSAPPPHEPVATRPTRTSNDAGPAPTVAPPGQQSLVGSGAGSSSGAIPGPAPALTSSPRHQTSAPGASAVSPHVQEQRSPWDTDRFRRILAAVRVAYLLSLLVALLIVLGWVIVSRRRRTTPGSY